MRNTDRIFFHRDKVMNYYVVKPEVAGGWGEHTEVDNSVYPPLVIKLHYEFDGWLGDALLESFPCYIVRKDVSTRIRDIGATGARFDGVEVSTSEQFKELYPGLQLPPFVWLRPEGRAGQDDFSLVPDKGLVVSERVLNLLRSVGVSHASVYQYMAS